MKHSRDKSKIFAALLALGQNQLNVVLIFVCLSSSLNESKNGYLASQGYPSNDELIMLDT